LASGNFDYAIRLLQNCCKLDPANLIYRRALRRTQKAKYGNNERGGRFALLTSAAARLRLKAARRARDPVKVLEHAEDILDRNPWDAAAQTALAESFAALDLLDHAVWCLEQVRRQAPADARVHRSLARLHERRGDFKQAMALWQQVEKLDP